MVARTNRKVKLARDFINLTDTCMHMYNEISGIKGDFDPFSVKGVSRCELAKVLKQFLTKTPDIYCVVNDLETAKKLFGDALEQVAIVRSEGHGRGGEIVTSLSWAPDEEFTVNFYSNEICV